MTDEQRAKRIHHHMYETCEGIAEHAERIVRLEEEIEKQKFKFEVLKAHGIEIVDAVGGGHEIYDTRQREVDRLEYENAKLRELARKQDALTKAVHAYWAGGEGSLDDFNVMMGANAQVLSLMRELGIEVEDA